MKSEKFIVTKDAEVAKILATTFKQLVQQMIRGYL